MLGIGITCTFMLQTFAVVSLLTDAVILSGVCAALTARHHIAAVLTRLTKGRAA